MCRGADLIGVSARHFRRLRRDVGEGGRRRAVVRSGVGPPAEQSSLTDVQGRVWLGE